MTYYYCHILYGKIWVSNYFIFCVNFNYWANIFDITGPGVRISKLFLSVLLDLLNWWKGKPPGSIACTRKQQPRFYWSCSSVVMNDATSLTPPSAWAELHFQMLTTYMYTPWSLKTRKIWLHNDEVRGDFLQLRKFDILLQTIHT